MVNKYILKNKLSVFVQKSITYKDYNQIINLISEDIGKAHILPLMLHRLYLFATYSKKYQSFNIPKNIVTVNSEIILVSDIQKKQLVKIILPGETNSKHDISIYSPIGIACLGAKENDHVFVNYKNTYQKLLIEKIVYQPEREMLYN